ncbi:hypothetical protein CDL12_08628 [Handroanthus impetiginosus]|uniref:CLAVATA3/ESR (CLE)-related protein n=1 Tax=Handroanthus impetiginosus TaxID=429701 RepID=A0A2G9HN43_9LAMI|nr:hypothetical protein CDL12_08628 [Handroanthus impetiginosus]
MIIPFHLTLTATFIITLLFFSIPSSLSIRREMTEISFNPPTENAPKNIFHSKKDHKDTRRSEEYKSMKRRVPSGSNPLHNKHIPPHSKH